MPEDKGEAMPTADLHGSTIAIETGKGEKTTFELVRLGTVKEFGTAKAALEGSKRAVGLSIKENDSLRAQVKDALAKAERSSNAYVAEKADSAELRELIGKQGNELADAQERLAAERSEHERTGNALSTEKEVSAELTKANQGLAEGIQRQKDTIGKLTAAFEAEESVSAQLTVERDRYEKERDEAIATAEDAERVYTKYRADHVAMTTELAGVKGERDVSRQALADLKAELLKDAGCMSDILDAMHKKITGE